MDLPSSAQRWRPKNPDAPNSATLTPALEDRPPRPYSPGRTSTIFGLKKGWVASVRAPVQRAAARKELVSIIYNGCGAMLQPTTTTTTISSTTPLCASGSSSLARAFCAGVLELTTNPDMYLS